MFSLFFACRVWCVLYIIVLFGFSIFLLLFFICLIYNFWESCITIFLTVEFIYFFLHLCLLFLGIIWVNIYKKIYIPCFWWMYILYCFFNKNIMSFFFMIFVLQILMYPILTLLPQLFWILFYFQLSMPFKTIFQGCLCGSVG